MEISNVYQFCADIEEETFAECRKAAEKGYVKAQLALGMLYATGLAELVEDEFGVLDVKENPDEARKWLGKAASSGDVQAQRELADFYGWKGNLLKSAMWYRNAAKLGDVASQITMAWKYVFGDVVSKDSSKAFEWMVKAVETSNSDSRRQICTLWNAVALCLFERKHSEMLVWYHKLGDERMKRSEIDWASMCARLSNVDNQKKRNAIFRWIKKWIQKRCF